MPKTRAEIFNESRPEITEAEVARAAKADRAVASFNALPIATDATHIGALAVKFLLGDGTTPVVILDPLACSTLRLLVEALDAASWRATLTTPPGETQH
jgi:hypothetical protein